MPLAGFEPAIPASEWAQTHAVDRAGTWIGLLIRVYIYIYIYIYDVNCNWVDTRWQ